MKFRPQKSGLFFIDIMCMHMYNEIGGDNMLDKRFPVLLSETLDRKLSELAKRNGVSKGEVIRKGIELLYGQLEDADREE